MYLYEFSFSFSKETNLDGFLDVSYSDSADDDSILVMLTSLGDSSTGNVFWG
jgi:hypothetical protein